MLTMPVRLLGDRDRSAIRTVLEREPIAGAQVAELVAASGVDWWRSGARLFGYSASGQLDALCWFGTNLIPVAAGPEAIAAFATIGRTERRRCSSIVGPADAVLDLWSRIRGPWGPARDVRTDQPLLAVDQPPAPAPDPAVRLVREDELDILLPAAVAMYTEEVGISPVRDTDGQPYRRRVGELIAGRRAYAKIVADEVVFKADLAVLTSHTAQIQGVWVPPRHRGHGYATAGVAAVVADALRRGIPTVSLYVNEHNHAARRVYERCGFREIGRFATVLF
ncbi:MAG: GNAT family N-acetyltransferase [Micromonosporaceae bacterium]